jgi:methionyl aminopeptidase
MAMMVKAKSAEELELMRQAGRIVAAALEALRQRAVAGITTLELDGVAETVIRDLGGIPSFKGYRGYPASICASINEQVVHGIPSKRALAEGDIVSLDVGVIWQGYQGDAAITVAVEPVSAPVRRLLEVTQAALDAGIGASREGQRLGDVSHAIEQVANAAGLQVIREYGGHGIGKQMHEPPRVPNWGTQGQGLPLRTGMTFALEPMLTLGGYETRSLADHWTVVTADHSFAAHYEHTIVVTERGGEILTRISASTLAT